MYDELMPEKVIDSLKLKQSTLWKDLVDFCPELEYKGRPKDRDFFLNILNTKAPRCMEKIVFNAIE